jgi:uncharacterized protein (TIGR02391 family)
MARRSEPPKPTIESRQWTTTDEIDRAIEKLAKRITELENLDIRAAVRDESAADKVAISNVRETIREVFGSNSPEFHEHEHIRMWAGGMWLNMEDHEILAAKENGRRQIIGILQGLIGRLREKREDLIAGHAPTAKAYLDYLNLHPRIRDVAHDLFEDGYHWEAVFAAAKSLVNYVKERSGQDKLDGAGLMRTVFSKNNPILQFNDLKDQTDQDEQEGMMHLFEGVVLGIRNPGGHSFPEGPEQRAVEYLSLISLLAYRLQEAKRPKKS